MTQRLLWLLGFLPAPLHRLALRLGHFLRFVLQRHFGMLVTGCTMICRNPAGEILLARHSYFERDGWTLPGGMMLSGEGPVAAACREILEEFGCPLDHARFYELEQAEYWGCRYDTFMIDGVVTGPLKPDGREISDARFFALDSLPEAMPDVARDRIERWVAQGQQHSPAPALPDQAAAEIPPRRRARRNQRSQ